MMRSIWGISVVGNAPRVRLKLKAKMENPAGRRGLGESDTFTLRKLQVGKHFPRCFLLGCVSAKRGSFLGLGRMIFKPLPRPLLGLNQHFGLQFPSGIISGFERCLLHLFRVGDGQR